MSMLSNGGAWGATNRLQDLDRDLQAIKQEAVDIGEALLELEEAVLYPRDLQLIVFVSLSPETTLRPATVQIKVNGERVLTQALDDEGILALRTGGAQRLYMGRLPYGQHTLAASLESSSETVQRYRHRVSATFLKGLGPKHMELVIQVTDRGSDPKLTLREW